MNPDAKRAADTLRKMADFMQMLAFPHDTGKIINACADLIESLAAELEQVKRERDSFEDALRSIVFYDGHKEWLVKLTDILENTQSIVACPLDHSRWHTEEHTIWMILIGMFGDWGTSIRGGWIERNKDAAEFIRSICTDDTDKED